MTAHIGRFWQISIIAIVVACGTLSATAGALPAQAAGPAPAQAALTGSTPRPVADGSAHLVGAYNPDRMLRVVVGLQPPHMAAEEQFIHDLEDRTSPQFHHFLTPDQWNARFAPSSDAEAAVVSWAQSRGFTVTQRYANRLLVDLTGTVRTIEAAFNVRINTYSVGNKTFFANDRDPTLPQSLNGVVLSVFGLDDYAMAQPASHVSGASYAAQPAYVPGPAYATGQAVHGDGNPKMRPHLGTGHGAAGRSSRSVARTARPELTSGLIDPTDIWSSQAYDFNALYAQGHCCNPAHISTGTPAETSIAIATAGDFSNGDVTAFLNQYGLAVNVDRVYIDGTPACCNVETTLDTEYSTAMSNSFGCWCDTAHVYVYEGANSLDTTFVDVENRIVNDNHVRSFSESWGITDTVEPTSRQDQRHAIFNNALGIGMTLTASDGDAGAYDNGSSLTVEYPASDPDIIGAGGTDLNLDGSGNFTSETAWPGGGGGCSSYWSTPFYQNYTGFDNGCGGKRSIPDISANAGIGQALYWSGSTPGGTTALYSATGTSIVAPELAGWFAQENAYLLAIGSHCGISGSNACAPMGDIHDAIYDEGINSYTPHNPYYDTTTGCNSGNGGSTGTGTGYCAGTGYDKATGWGSYNALQLAWSVTRYFLFDFSSPTVTFDASDPSTSVWYNSDQTITWGVADFVHSGDYGNAGVSGYTAAWDADPGNPTSHATPGSGDPFYAGPATPNSSNVLTMSGALQLASAGQGCHDINVRSWDNNGNGSDDTLYGPLCYDTIPPQTTALLDGAAVSSSPYSGPVSVSFSATDPGESNSPPTGSGVHATYYQLDPATGGSWTLSSGSPFTVSSPGSHVLNYYSVDLAGNTESTGSVAFTISGRLTVTTLAPSSVGTTTAKLHGQVNLNGASAGCAVFVYGAPYTSIVTTGQTVSGSGTLDVTQTVSGLARGTVYHAYLDVTDRACGTSGGTQYAGDDVPFLTPVSLAPGWNFVALPTTEDTSNASALATELSSATSGHFQGLSVMQHGRWQLFVPGYSRDFALSFGEGIVVLVSGSASYNWTPGGALLTSGGTVSLGAGWNVAAPVRATETVAQICSDTGATEVVTRVGSTSTPFTCSALPSSTPTIANAQSVYLLESTARTWTQL